MTFKHKLSRRLAMLKDAWLVLALAASGCEKPSTLTDPPATIRLHIAPKSVTLPTDGATQLLAVALTSAGDSTTLPVNWSVTGGSIANTSTSRVPNYADYKATSPTGVFNAIAGVAAGRVSRRPDAVTGGERAAVECGRLRRAQRRQPAGGLLLSGPRDRGEGVEGHEQLGPDGERQRRA